MAAFFQPPIEVERQLLAGSRPMPMPQAARCLTDDRPPGRDPLPTVATVRYWAWRRTLILEPRHGDSRAT